jgi:hypothetical protein
MTHEHAAPDKLGPFEISTYSALGPSLGLRRRTKTKYEAPGKHMSSRRLTWQRSRPLKPVGVDFVRVLASQNMQANSLYTLASNGDEIVRLSHPADFGVDIHSWLWVQAWDRPGEGNRPTSPIGHCLEQTVRLISAPTGRLWKTTISNSRPIYRLPCTFRPWLARRQQCMHRLSNRPSQTRRAGVRRRVDNRASQGCPSPLLVPDPPGPQKSTPNLPPPRYCRALRA